jgi:hypothetical protein
MAQFSHMSVREPLLSFPSMRHLFRILIVAVLSILAALAGCGDPAVSNAQLLASDRHFIIGGHRITVPAVALRGPDHVFDLGSQNTENTTNGTSETAGDPDHPAQADKLDLIIREYQYTNEMTASTAICPYLKRTWSQTVCRGKQHGVLSRLPEKFDLLGRLDLLKGYSTVGRERTFDQVNSKSLQLGITEIGCDQHSSYCTAAVEVLPDLLAVWTVWSDEKSGIKVEQMALSQGAAIVQFVRRGLGTSEDPTLVSLD